MAKKWIAELVALTISITSWTPLHGENLSSPGNSIVMEVESAYKEGKYDQFLRDLHTHFQNAGRAGALRGIFESAKIAMKHQSAEAIEKRKNALNELDKKRNDLLLGAIAKDPESDIAKRVHSVVFYSIDPKCEAILQELDQLKYMIPETAAATIDNKISALETEYYIKSLLLDVGSLHGKKSSSEEIAKKKIALALEKLDKMEEAAKDYGDKDWEEKIQIAKSGFRTERAFRVDLDVLQKLAFGNIAPKNPVEENVQEIMMEYQHEKQTSLDTYRSEIVSN